MSSRPLVRVLLTSLLVVLAMAGGGVANALWSQSGNGPGSATTGTAVAVTLSPGTPAADLFPGGQANVVLTVSNPNASPLHIGSLSLDSGQGTDGFSVDVDHSGCGLATLSFTPQDNSGAGWSVPARVGDVNGTLPVTLTNALSMSLSASNACQGATTAVYLSAGP
jgi:hypothetical protein